MPSCPGFHIRSVVIRGFDVSSRYQSGSFLVLSRSRGGNIESRLSVTPLDVAMVTDPKYVSILLKHLDSSPRSDTCLCCFVRSAARLSSLHRLNV